MRFVYKTQLAAWLNLENLTPGWHGDTDRFDM